MTNINPDDATMPANGADPKAQDCDLLAPSPLPPGVDSAGPWRTDQAGHLLRDLSDGRLQHGDGEAVAACRHCTERDNLSVADDTITDMTTIPNLPTGATNVTEAFDGTRVIFSDHHNVGGVSVCASMVQDGDRLETTGVQLGGGEQDLTPVQARELAHNLLEAATLAERWAV